MSKSPTIREYYSATGRSRLTLIDYYSFWWWDGDRFRFTFLSVRNYVPVGGPDGTA